MLQKSHRVTWRLKNVKAEHLSMTLVQFSSCKPIFYVRLESRKGCTLCGSPVREILGRLFRLWRETNSWWRQAVCCSTTAESYACWFENK